MNLLLAQAVAADATTKTNQAGGILDPNNGLVARFEEATGLPREVALWSVNILGAIVILVAGWILAGFARGLVRNLFAKRNIDPTVGGFVGNVAHAAIMAFVIVTALGQLGVDTKSFAAIIAAAGLAMWGFMTVMNDVLIAHLRTVFPGMPWWQTLSVNFCFFGAYFVGSLAYYLRSQSGVDPIAQAGYKRALIAGLLLSACGTALFVPATYVNVFGFYLFALFILGLGFTLLQIAANPFVAIIGTAEGASSRLNLAQAFNSLGTTLAPILGGTLIFSVFKGDDAVRWPYAAVTGLLLLQAAWVYFTALPEPPRPPKRIREYSENREERVVNGE